MNIRDLFSDFTFWLEAGVGYIIQHFPLNKWKYFLLYVLETYSSNIIRGSANNVSFWTLSVWKDKIYQNYVM